MWTDAVQLLSAVRQIVAAKSEDRERLAVPFLERLKRHEQSLVAPMKNRPRSPADLERLRTKKVQLDGLGEVDLEESLIEEALILAGLFGLNELDAVDLLLIGEQQSPQMDGLPRGLLAVVSYFDAKRMQVAVLAELLAHDLTDSLTTFTKDRLAKRETLTALLDIVQSTNVETVFNQLSVQSVNGLGPANHKRMIESALLETVEFAGRAALSLVSRCGDEQRVQLADEILGRVKCVSAGDTLDARRLLEWATLVRLILTASEQEDDAASVALLERIATATSPESGGKKTDDWADAAILASIQLAVACASCAVTINPGAAFVSADSPIRRNSLWLDAALSSCAPQFLLLAIARSSALRSRRFVRETVGILLDDLLRRLVDLFPAKMRELHRVGEDELTLNFDGLLADGALVTGPRPKLALLAFLETIAHLHGRSDESGPNDFLPISVAEKWTTEQALLHFLAIAQHALQPAHIVGWLKMLTALCVSENGALHIYAIFDGEDAKLNGQSWDSLWAALAAYLDHYERIERTQRDMSAELAECAMPPDELAGLIAWLALAERCALHAPLLRVHFLNTAPSSSLLATLCALAARRVPLPLKSAIVRLLRALALHQPAREMVAGQLLHKRLLFTPEDDARASASGTTTTLESQRDRSSSLNQSLRLDDRQPFDGGTNDSTQQQQQKIAPQKAQNRVMGLVRELEERECVVRQYDVTLASVRLLVVLLANEEDETGASLDESRERLLAPAVNYVTRHVIARLVQRVYHNGAQTWRVLAAAFELCARLLARFSVPRQHGILALGVQVLNATPLLGAIVAVLREDGSARASATELERKGESKGEDERTIFAARSSAALGALRLFATAVARHSAFRELATSSAALTLRPMRTLLARSDGVMVASLESLLFVPLEGDVTLIEIGLQYLEGIEARTLAGRTVAARDELQLAWLATNLVAHVAAHRRLVALLREQQHRRLAATQQRKLARAAALLLDVDLNGRTLECGVRTVPVADGRLVSARRYNDVDGEEQQQASERLSVRGACARLLLEACCSSAASVNDEWSEDRHRNAFALMLCGYDQDGGKTAAEKDETPMMTTLLKIVAAYATTERPFEELPFAGLFEPTFRLITTLVATSPGNASSWVQRKLRAANLPFQLLQSPELGELFTQRRRRRRNEEDEAETSYRRLCAAAALKLGAAELHFCLAEGVLRQGRALLGALLDDRRERDDDGDELNSTTNLLFGALTAGFEEPEDPEIPTLRVLDAARIQTLLDSGAISVCGGAVSQIDVVLLRDALLQDQQRQLSADYRDEVETVLRWTASCNGAALGRTSARRLVSSAATLLQLVAVFAPLESLSIEQQLSVLGDAAKLLAEYNGAAATEVSGKEAAPNADVAAWRLVSGAHKRVVTALCRLAAQQSHHVRQTLLLPTVSLLDAALQSASRPLEARAEILDALRLCLETVGAEEAEQEDRLRVEVTKRADRLTTLAVDDAVHWPSALKSAPLRLIAALAAEAPLIVVKRTVRTGLCTAMVDTLKTLHVTNWRAARESADARTLDLYTAIMTTFLAVARVPLGGQSLLTGGTGLLETLSGPPPLALLESPPSDLFDSEASSLRAAATPFIAALDLVIHLLAELASHAHWRRASAQILAAIRAHDATILHAARALPNLEALRLAAAIVKRVYDQDPSTRQLVEGSAALRTLLKL